MDVKQEQLAKWLGITEQQNQILQTIYRLESAGTETSPTNILTEYSRTYGKRIQSNNLFTIIRKLAEEGLIKKKEKARYAINTEGMRDRLTQKSMEQKKELLKVDEVIKNLDQYYKAAAADIKPEMTFYGTRELFNKTAEALRNATVYYATTRMPNIAFTRPIAHKLGVDRYIDVQHEKCFVKKDLKIVYITQLMTGHLYKNALEIYGKPELAVREVEMMLDHLWNNILSNENIEAYYLPNLLGLYMTVIEKHGDPTEAVLFLQSENHVNGIYLKSREIAYQARKSFLNGLENATPLTGATGRKLIRDVKKRVREHAEK
jgi:hypothetical protein